jgi:hypothetical protein
MGAKGSDVRPPDSSQQNDSGSFGTAAQGLSKENDARQVLLWLKRLAG